MADTTETIILVFIIVAAIILLLIYGYIWSIRKVYASLGLDSSMVSLILLGILIFGWIPIPLFPYGGWIVGISVGGALIPLIVSIHLIRKRMIDPAEGFIGVVIVSFITYVLTRVEPGVGIVADIQFAFLPAISAALYSVSIFWQEAKRTAPLAFVSGTLGSVIGADVFRLSEILSTSPSPGGADFLVIGGGVVYDMVFLSGIVAVAMNLIIAQVIERRTKTKEVQDKFAKYQRDLVSEYEKIRINKEREILRRSTQWDKGVPYDYRYRFRDYDVEKKKDVYAAKQRIAVPKKYPSTQYQKRDTYRRS